MIIPDDQTLAVAVQFLQEQIRSNLTYVQENPSAVVLALLQSMQTIHSNELSYGSMLIHESSINDPVLTNCTTNLRGLKDAMIKESTSSNDFIMNTGLSIMCVVFAGLASGLTQGLLSLDYMEMKIKSQSGTPKEKAYAEKLLPIISNHHLLLVSLMLWNASATEALPIFLDKMVPEFVAIIISVTLVLLFGEIIPASILTGPQQLQIAANLIPLVYVVFVVFFPLAYPISKLLDYIIGHDEGLTIYSRKELKTMMKLQHEEGLRRSVVQRDSAADFRDTMHHDEVTIIGGALSFRDTMVSQVMTHERNVFMISINEKLSYKTLYDIFKSGYSRIPVYDRDRNDVVGLILAKDLIFIDPEDETPIRNFVNLFGRKPMVVWHDQKLGETLAMFRNEHAHLAIVRDVEVEGEGDPFYKVVGIITLEDIIEEILGTEIEDETDVPNDPHFLYNHKLFFNGIDPETGSPLDPGAPAVRSESGAGPSSQVVRLQHLRDMDFARLQTLQEKLTTNGNISDEDVSAIAYYLQVNVPQVEKAIIDSVYNKLSTVGGSSTNGATASDYQKSIQEYIKAQADVITMKRKTPSILLDSVLTGNTATNTTTTATNTTKTTSDFYEPLLPAGASETDPKEYTSQTPSNARRIATDDMLYRRGKMSNSCVIILEGYVKVLTGADEKATLFGPWSTLGADALLVPEGTYIPDFTAFVDSETVRFVRLSAFTAQTLNARDGWSNLVKKKHDLLFSPLATLPGATSVSVHQQPALERSKTGSFGSKAFVSKASFDGGRASMSLNAASYRESLTSLVFGGDVINHDQEKAYQRQGKTGNSVTFNPITTPASPVIESEKRKKSKKVTAQPKSAESNAAPVRQNSTSLSKDKSNIEGRTPSTSTSEVVQKLVNSSKGQLRDSL